MEYALYTATAVGAMALFLMMPRRGYNPRKLGALLGAAVLGGLWLWLARFIPDVTGLPRGAMPYYYIFSFIAIASAVRVITHTKPVYAALWFVMVILSSAGLFLTLEAEFMAFAMVIIYGGAILVTYVFVIMLAARTAEPDQPDVVGDYDRVAREPAAAIVAGFLLLGVLLSVTFDVQRVQPNPAAAGPTDQTIIEQVLTDRPIQRLAVSMEDGPTEAAGARRLDNAERIGLDLFRSHPLGLELAGVILLVSLVGAVVIARQRVQFEATTEPTATGAPRA